MTGAHLHLLVNHAPILGSFFAMLLLLASFRWAPEVLARTALVVLIATAVASAVANYSGEPAEDQIRGLPGVKREVIHDHEEMGEWGFRVAVIVGIAGIAALARYRHGMLPNGARTGFTLATVVLFGLMGYVGLLGGRVRHTEVRPGATKEDAMIVEPPRQRPPAPVAP
jgi:hypothetical protein